jgi:casein kinase 1
MHHTSKLGNGAFGDIYLATNTQTNEKVAVKLESKKARHSLLLNEARLMNIISKSDPLGFPRVALCLRVHCCRIGMTLHL